MLCGYHTSPSVTFFRMGTNTYQYLMSKNIAISDEVYRMLKREKGDRSFSEVIEAHIQSGGTLGDVTGQEIFEPGTIDAVKDDIEGLSSGTLERLDE